MNLTLANLDGTFVKITGDKSYRRIKAIASADGVLFLCPKCFLANNRKRPGVHSVLCWRPHVPQTWSPKPGRWQFRGTGLKDLTLVAGSSSILLKGGCAWHGYIQSGRVTDA